MRAPLLAATVELALGSLFYRYLFTPPTPRVAAATIAPAVSATVAASAVSAALAAPTLPPLADARTTVSDRPITPRMAHLRRRRLRQLIRRRLR